MARRTARDLTRVVTQPASGGESRAARGPGGRIWGIARVSEAAIAPDSRHVGTRGDAFAFHEARRACSLARRHARMKNRNKFKKEDEESGRVVAHLYALNLPPAQLRVAELEQQRLELGHLGADGVVHQPNRVELRGQPPRPVLIRGKREHISGAIGVKVERQRGLRVEPRQAAGQPVHLRGARVRVVRVLAPHGVIPERRTAVTVHGWRV